VQKREDPVPRRLHMTPTALDNGRRSPAQAPPRRRRAAARGGRRRPV
jgi:hypothetical protein